MNPENGLNFLGGHFLGTVQNLYRNFLAIPLKVSHDFLDDTQKVDPGATTVRYPCTPTEPHTLSCKT